MQAGIQMIFGLHPVMEALASGRELDKIMIHREAAQNTTAELVALARNLGVEVQRVPLVKLNQITRKNHQGVIAWLSQVSYASLDHVVTEVFASGKMPLLLLLDHITDVRNMGAIVRTAECAGVQAIVVPSKGSAQINADAMKASAGALMHLPVCREMRFTDAIKYLKDSGLRVIAATEKASQSLYETDLTGPLAIVLGSEEEGISREILTLADELISIPLLGKVGSLNVSVAGGVVLYEALRQRKSK